MACKSFYEAIGYYIIFFFYSEAPKCVWAIWALGCTNRSKCSLERTKMMQMLVEHHTEYLGIYYKQ